MSAPAPDPRLAERLFERMALIRLAEERIAQLYPEQEMRCPTHLSIGQEAVAAGLCAALETDDWLFLNHRCHAGYLAKGGDLRRMFAELYGKSTGCTGGRGGSMHLIDPEAGVRGTSALLAATIPIACGAAFGFLRGQGGKRRAGPPRVAACMFGDAAVEEGTFFESINLAAVWRLPVVFVCENNGLSTTTPLEKRQPPVPIAERVAAFGIDAARLDGNDAYAVHAAAARAVARARAGGGPSFLECATYRWLEHVGPNFDWDLGYRSKAQVEEGMRGCPLARFERRADEEGTLPSARREELRARIRERVEDAVRFAKDSPFPDPDGAPPRTAGRMSPARRPRKVADRA